MAQMFSGQPRSGSSPKLRLADAPRLSQFDWRLEDLNLTPRQGRTVTIGRQTYREVDNGRANVVVPIGDPLRSPAEYAEQQQALRQAARFAQSPFGALAYNALALAGAPKRVRDAGLGVGEVVDAVAGGRAVRTGPVRRQPLSPGGQVAAPTLKRQPIRLRELNNDGQAQGAIATLTAPMLGTGTAASQSLRPPGFISGRDPLFDARGHLLAKRLGGRGDDPRNLVTLTRHANSPQMSGFESAVAGRVRAGEVVEYSSTPLYRQGASAPTGILVTASGSRGAPAARFIPNPAGRRR